MANKQRIFVALLLIAFAIFPAFLQAQDNSDRAKRTYESGLEFYRQGDYRNAMRDFNTVVSGYSLSLWVDDALLQMAVYEFEIEGNRAEAQRHLERIITQIPDSNSAPKAYYQLGDMQLSQLGDEISIQDGRANLTRLYRLFPGSDSALRARLRMIKQLTFERSYSAAISSATELLQTSLDQEMKQGVLLQLSIVHYLNAEIDLALETLQKIAVEFPGSQTANHAVNRATLIYRLHMAKKHRRPFFVSDPAFSKSFREPTYVAMAPGDSLYISDRRQNRVTSTEISSPRDSNSYSVSAPEKAIPAPDGELVSLSRGQLSKGGKLLTFRRNVGEEIRQLKDIFAFSITATGDYVLFDRREKLLARYNKSMELIKVYQGNVKNDIVDIILDSRGNMYLLDTRGQTIVRVDINTRASKKIGPTVNGLRLRRPKGIALDAFDNLYILDEELKKVFVLSAALQTISSIDLSSLRNMRGIAVDATGRIYIIDSRNKTVVRFK